MLLRSMIGHTDNTDSTDILFFTKTGKNTHFSIYVGLAVPTRFNVYIFSLIASTQTKYQPLIFVSYRAISYFVSKNIDCYHNLKNHLYHTRHEDLFCSTEIAESSEIYYFSTTDLTSSSSFSLGITQANLVLLSLVRRFSDLHGSFYLS